MEELIAIDLGSTRTKGALFRSREGKLQVMAREEGDTTTGDLQEGFFSVLEALASRSLGKTGIAYSSSARGGLSICAVGIVPALTLKMARQTALSAGGKVTSHYAYKLTDEDIEAIEATDPDIILFTGGTDGGNEDYLLHNAAALAGCAWEGPILYGGNRSLRSQIREILKNKELFVVENLLPEIDQPNPEPARREIRRIFLERLCEGKGLGEIIRRTGEKPVPTPSAIFDFISLPGFSALPPFRDGALLFDVGGATSDCYSVGLTSAGTDRILRGLPEPDPKRTVEGDLGLRISAPAAVACAREEGLLQGSMGLDETALRELEAYALGVSRNPERPAAEEDRLLAEICLTLGLIRHAGRMRQSATTSGRVVLQEGKDLTPAEVLIATGGFLSRSSSLPNLPAPPLLDRQGQELLIPRNPRLLQDRDYLWPLLANAARLNPHGALRLAPDLLVPTMQDKRSNHES